MKDKLFSTIYLVTLQPTGQLQITDRYCKYKKNISFVYFLNYFIVQINAHIIILGLSAKFDRGHFIFLYFIKLMISLKLYNFN